MCLLDSYNGIIYFVFFKKCSITIRIIAGLKFHLNPFKTGLLSFNSGIYCLCFHVPKLELRSLIHSLFFFFYLHCISLFSFSISFLQTCITWSLLLSLAASHSLSKLQCRSIVPGWYCMNSHYRGGNRLLCSRSSLLSVNCGLHL